MSSRPGEILELKPWVTVAFPHFIGVRHVNGPWATVWFGNKRNPERPHKLDLEKLGLKVELHANGIEILE